MNTKGALFARVMALLLAVGMLAGCATAATGDSYETFTGSVTGVEKYGHCNTSIKWDQMQAAGYQKGDVVRVTFDNGYTFEAPIVGGYEVDKGDKLIRTLYSDDGTIAVCINYGKMNVEAGADIGSLVTVEMADKAAYLSEYEIRSLKYNDERSDYASDEVFANYRPMIEGKLYRGSHPAKEKWARAPYVAALMERDGIVSDINMSDSVEELEGKILLESNPHAGYLRTLYENGAVIALDMSAAYEAEDFSQKIAQSLYFMLENPAPFYVHCNEGKDRTGFFGIFIEGLLGWDDQAILDDYMASFENYYKLEKGSAKYEVVKKSNFDPMYAYIKGDAPTLQEGARNYALSLGLSEAEVDQLVNLLK